MMKHNFCKPEINLGSLTCPPLSKFLVEPQESCDTLFCLFHRANAQVGFGDTLGGSAGFQAGPIGANISAGVNNNLLMTVIVGLGLLSFLNIVATVATPFLSSFTSGKSTQMSI